MSDKVRGVMEKYHVNDKGIHSFCVNDQWYGTYKTDFSNLKGEEVEFSATSKNVRGRVFWDAKDVKAVPRTAGPSGGGGGAVRTGTEREASIVLQSCYKVAADLLSGLIAADKVALGAKGAAFDTARGFLDELAVSLYHNCSNPLEFIETIAPSEDELPYTGEEDEYDPTKA